MSNRYELLYIIPTSLTEEEAGEVETKVNALLAKNSATVESSKRLGKLKLAYPINNERHGYYVQTLFTIDGAALAKFDENLRILSGVIRHLIVRADEVGEQKFDLVQYAEVIVETKDDRRRKEKEQQQKEGEKEEVKDEKKEEAAPADKAEVSPAEVDAKIESALSKDAETV